MKLAVVGATGIVGEALLRVLEERNVPVSTLSAFASRSRNGGVSFRNRALEVQAVNEQMLREHDAVFFASSEDASARYAPGLIESGAVVIDNSSTYRMQPGVPLIVPEVNAGTLPQGARLFPVANCTAIILSVALAPVRDWCGLESVTVATYQAVSGAGRAGLAELEAAEKAVAFAGERPAPSAFAANIARNVIPQIGNIGRDGYSEEESKVREETRKILDLPELPLSVIACRVPVRFAHSEAVFFQTLQATSLPELSSAFAHAPGIVFHPHGIVTPREVEGNDEVHVARLRAEDGSNRRFAMWICGDQVRKGAATNAVQILELLLARGEVSK